jgi:hypothetical protein
MSFDQLRPSQQSPDAPIARVQPIWAAEVYEDAADVNSTVRVRLPTADGGVKLFGPCPFMPRGSAVPQKGDQALLAFDDEGEPWIIGWQGSFSGGGGGSYTDEEARDAVGAALTDSSTIDFTVNDGANTITADVKNSGITSAQIADGTIVHGDVAAANKDGADATPSLRTLGTGASQAAKGDSTVNVSGDQTGLAGDKAWTGLHEFADDVEIGGDLLANNLTEPGGSAAVQVYTDTITAFGGGGTGLIVDTNGINVFGPLLANGGAPLASDSSSYLTALASADVTLTAADASAWYALYGHATNKVFLNTPATYTGVRRFSNPSTATDDLLVEPDPLDPQPATGGPWSIPVGETWQFEVFLFVDEFFNYFPEWIRTI